MCRPGDHGYAVRPRGSCGVAAKRCGTCSRSCPSRPRFTSAGCACRARSRADGVFASQSPGFYDDLLLVDSTPVECARSRETVKRSGASSLADALANAADYGYCASHSRFFWGFRLHAIFAPDGTPRALALASPKIDEKLVCLQLVARASASPGKSLILIGDKGFRGKDFEAELASLDAHDRAAPPQRRARPGPAPRADPPTHREDLLDLQGPPHPRTPRRPHPRRPPRAHAHTASLPRRRHRTQPPTRPPQPSTRQLHRLKPWHYSSRGLACGSTSPACLRGRMPARCTRVALRPSSRLCRAKSGVRQRRWDPATSALFGTSSPREPRATLLGDVPTTQTPTPRAKAPQTRSRS